MHLLRRAAAIVILGFTLVVDTPVPVHAQTRPATGQAQTKAKATHQVVVQVSQNDPQVMNVALNNIENLVKYYEEKGEKVEVEFVAYGPGLRVRPESSAWDA